MFERITLDRQGVPGKPIDLGTLAECLVFYDKVRVITDQVTFPYLVRSCGAEELLHLHSMGTLEIEYIENLTGVLAKPSAAGVIYDMGCIQSSSLHYLGVARKLFDDYAGPSGKGANKFFNKFERLVRRSGYTPAILDESRNDWIDEEYVTDAARALLSWKVPDYRIPEGLEFKIKKDTLGFHLRTNIDFDAADALFAKRAHGERENINASQLLVNIANTRRDLIIGSQFGSEFALSPAQALVATCKFSQVLRKANAGLQSAELFQDEVVEGIPRIKDIVNSGERGFSHVIRLVESADDFKKWLKKNGGDESLRRAYLRDVSHLDWADKMPPKTLRFLLFAGTSAVVGFLTNPIVGAVAGTALSASDYFLLDRFLKGWKPNQFVEGSLTQFLRG
jgi:hypothetical protein